MGGDCDEDVVAALRDRLDELEAKVERQGNRTSRLEDHHEHWTKDRINEASEDRRALRGQMQELEEQVAELEQRLESMAGLADDQRSTPDKRAADLRQAMIRAAQNTTTQKAGAKWWKGQVEDTLAALGHEGLANQQLYNAMEDAAEQDGFEMTTKTVTKHGRTWDAKAIRLDLEELPGATRNNEIIMPGEGSGPENTVVSATTEEN